jgi:hypothetical protein
MNALDLLNVSSSWNSEGNNQNETTLTIHFGRLVHPTLIKFQFQAGFSAELVSAYNAEDVKLGEFELDDIHEVQTHNFLEDEASLDRIKLILSTFSDFYGRVILYRLEVWGYEVQTA